ncbi:MAG: hypothetical protein HYY57_03055 [Candidatus Omnitrophica bacterium]|nr:hypothetical protein [Candidatus Omnitrophota bacterium]
MPSGQIQGTTTQAYWIPVRQGGVTQKMAACHRPLKSRSDFGDWIPEMLRISRDNPPVSRMGWADWLRRPSLLVACVLFFEYAALLAPRAARHCAQRGHAIIMLGALR